MDQEIKYIKYESKADSTIKNSGICVKNADANFSQQDIKEEASKKEKFLAVWMYAHGYSFRTISRFLKVSAKSVFVWLKNSAKNNYSKPAPTDDSVVIELDEMWPFVRSKKDKYEFGRPTAEPQNSSLIGNAAHERPKK